MADPAVIGALISGVSDIATNVWSAREARRRAAEAHQVEAEDLRKAGLNPMLSVGRGADTSVPSFASAGASAVNSAAAIGLLKAQRELTVYQAAKTREEAETIANLRSPQIGLLQAQRHEILTRADFTEAELDRLRQSLPLFLEQAREEIRATVASARQAAAAAALDEAAEAGALNVEAFERSIGELGPWGRTLARLLELISRTGGRR